MVNKTVEDVNSVMGDSLVEYQQDRGAMGVAFGSEHEDIQPDC